MLKNVPLSGTTEIAAQMIEESYLQYLTPDLRDRWKRNPDQALGRLTSSPWPERIDILSIEKTGEDYTVHAEVVYMTSQEMAHGGDAGRDKVTLTLVPKLWNNFMPQGWAISSVAMQR
ncbi:MAG: hypothetical protein ABIO72_01440 [Patescibacteria group bacterium]